MAKANIRTGTGEENDPEEDGRTFAMAEQRALALVATGTTGWPNPAELISIEYIDEI